MCVRVYVDLCGEMHSLRNVHVEARGHVSSIAVHLIFETRTR